MVKFVGLSATIGLNNVFDGTLGTFFDDAANGYFGYAGTSFSTVSNRTISINLSPLVITLSGKFHAEVDGPNPTFQTEYTGTVRTIAESLFNAPTYLLTKLGLPLIELQTGSGGGAILLMAEIFKGDDKIIGSEAGDFVRGHAGNDRMFGKGGPDSLIGDGGRDLIDGGLGNDGLQGRNGGDTFRFSTALGPTNSDFISDFEHRDQIQLSHHVFTKLGSSGHLPAGNFVIGPAALDHNDFIVYNNANGKAYYDADGNGAGAAVQFATILNGFGAPAVLGHNDFDLI